MEEDDPLGLGSEMGEVCQPARFGIDFVRIQVPGRGNQVRVYNRRQGRNADSFAGSAEKLPARQRPLDLF